jgi:phosphoglycolate phosphatase-like HAD superfamily hydrolase
MRIAFDLDGTLITCRSRQCRVVQAVMRQFAQPPLDLDFHWRRKREGLNTVDALIAAGIPSETARGIGAAWTREIERWPWLTLDRMFPEVLELLDLLINQGAALAIVTARNQERLACLQTEQMGLHKRAARFFTVDPARAVTAKAAILAEFGADLYVGDTENDAQSASLAKKGFVSVSTGQRSAEFLKAKGIAPVFDSLIAALEPYLRPRNKTDSDHLKEMG